MSLGEANTRDVQRARRLAVARTRLRMDLYAAGVLRMAVDQLRDPHTGEWVNMPGAGSHKAAKLLQDIVDDSSPSEMTDEMAAVFDGTYAGLTVRVHATSWEENPYAGIREDGTAPHGIRVQAHILARDGTKVGDATRMVGADAEGHLFAVHEQLVIDPDVQGQGFAEAFSRHVDGWYRKSDVDRIEMTANVDVGGYAWARAGYDFRDRVPQAIQDRLDEVVGNSPGAVTPEVDDILRRIRAGKSVSAFEISQLGRPPGAGRDDTWLGKQVMLGSSWEAVRWL